MKLLMRSAVILAIAAFSVGMAMAQSASDKGAEVFKKSNCAMCHGADGKGQTPAGKSMKAGDFTSSDVQNLKDSELQNIIENGKGKMPAYKSKLKDEEVEQIVAYIRTLKGK